MDLEARAAQPVGHRRCGALLQMGQFGMLMQVPVEILLPAANVIDGGHHLGHCVCNGHRGCPFGLGANLPTVGLIVDAACER